MKYNSKNVYTSRSGRVCLFLLFTLSFFILTSCEVDFSPNAPWKEIPVVYSVLDQDDDTSWVRVEKCYLGEGNLYSYSSISDSINYPLGSIDVLFLVYQDGACIDTIVCRDTVRDRQPGNFASQAQPLYYTTHPLNQNHRYALLVRRHGDQATLASTDPIPLIRQTTENYIVKPANNDHFGFFGQAPFRIEWNPLENARLYQPFIRFYYSQEGDTSFVDVPCGTVASTAGLAYSLKRTDFLSSLEGLLDTTPKRYVKKVDIYVAACSEDLNVFVSPVDGNSGIDQGTEPYTNIHGGVGVFAARRTKLHRTIPADSSLVPNVGLYWFLLNQIDIGFGH